jgi:hypothetical protein
MEDNCTKSDSSFGQSSSSDDEEYMNMPIQKKDNAPLNYN